MTNRLKNVDKGNETASLGFALRDYRLRRRIPIFQLADELKIPSGVLVAIEMNQPIEGASEDVDVWLDTVKSLLAERCPPAALYIPPFLRD